MKRTKNNHKNGLCISILMGLLGLAAPLGLGGCHHEAHHEAEVGRYEATRPLRKDTVVAREYVAQIQASQHIELRALERGYLDDIFVDEGRPVKKGDRLFQIMPTMYRAELERARAEATFAEIEFDNTRSLKDGDVVSPQELAMAQARLDRANAEKDLASAHLKLTQLRAPFDGIMGRLEVRRGSLLEEGELLTTLSDNSEMWVYFNLTEPEYLDQMMDKRDDAPLPVHLRLANGRRFDQEGAVTAIEADFNNETGNIAFRATFPNPDGLLRHGETGKVIVEAPLKDALLLPQKAVFEVLHKSFVFVVDEAGTVHQREIRIDQALPHVIVVGAGLGEEDRVLLEGLRKVRDGDHVAIAFSEPEEALAQLELPAE